MAWELQLLSPLGVHLATVTQATSPNPVMGSVEAVVDAGGRTNQLTARVRQDLIQAVPRGILRYSVDSVPIAAGVIVTSPVLTSPGSGPADREADALDRITAVGLEQLLQDSIIGPRMFTTDTDVATIALELCQLYSHPALIVDPSNFPLAGYSLGVFYSPEKTLYAALDQLAETVPGGLNWFVNPDREILFNA